MTRRSLRFAALALLALLITLMVCGDRLCSWHIKTPFVEIDATLDYETR